MSFKKPKRISKNFNVSRDYYKSIEMISKKLNRRFMSLSRTEQSDLCTTSCYYTNLNHSIFTNSTTFYNSGIQLTLHPYRMGINIHVIEIQPEFQKKGIGTEIMNIILNISNKLNIPIYLIPVEMGNVTIGVLRKFYHGFGFKRESDSRYWKYSPVRVFSFCESEYKMIG